MKDFAIMQSLLKFYDIILFKKTIKIILSFNCTTKGSELNV